MPVNQDNLRRWQEQADIDWFSQFIKAWIPFNAWFRYTYGHDLSERKVLEGIKAGGNVVFSGITPLLTNTSQDAENFRQHIALLHERLENCVITNGGRSVSFRQVDVGPNSNKVATESFRRVNYTVERDRPASGNVSITLTTNGGRSILSHAQSTYDLDQLRTESLVTSLDPEKRERLFSLYKKVSPRLEEDLLNISVGTLEIGTFRFRNDTRLIFAALVEILYCLRCVLFHGEITPNDQNNHIYEPAYYIVRRFVKCTL